MKKLTHLIFLMYFCTLSYCPIRAIEDGVYWIGRTQQASCYVQTSYHGSGMYQDTDTLFYLEAIPKSDGVKVSGSCSQGRYNEMLPQNDLWSIEHLEDGYSRICSDTEVEVKCLEAFPSMAGKSLVKLSPPSSHQNQLWSIKPLENGYSICSNTAYLGLRCLGTGNTTEVKAGDYERWWLRGTYYRFNNLERSDKQQDIRLEILEQKLDELKRTSEQQANDLIKYSNRLSSLEKFNEQLNLFSSSFINGAVYSLVPEIIKDSIEFNGYPKAANVAAIIMQGGLIAYNAASYASTITGVAVRSGVSYFGFSDQTSVIAGSTAAIMTAVSRRLLNEEEAAFDCITGFTLALAGSYAGSTLALKAKSSVYEFWNNGGSSVASQVTSWVSQARSWAYGFWDNSGNASKQPNTATVSTLQRTISEQAQRIKELERLKRV